MNAASPLQTPTIREKTHQTLLDRFGVENPHQAPSVIEKYKETCIERYGVENPAQLDSVKAAAIVTNQKKYGTDHPSQNAEVRAKVKSTVQQRYGVDNQFQNEDVKEKSRQTLMSRYGVSNPAQSPELQEKNQRTACQFKAFTMPSGTVRKLQGYEPLAIQELLTAAYTEEQIRTDRKSVPRILYTFQEKQHYYFPDIYLPHENRIIEVKSDWTYTCNVECNTCKKNACIAAGYRYDVWIYSKKGEKRVA